MVHTKTGSSLHWPEGQLFTPAVDGKAEVILFELSIFLTGWWQGLVKIIQILEHSESELKLQLYILFSTVRYLITVGSMPSVNCDFHGPCLVFILIPSYLNNAVFSSDSLGNRGSSLD